MKHLALCLLVLPLGLFAEDKELPLVLPKSVALGTPRPMKINNLEPVSGHDHRLGIRAPGHDFTIALDGDSLAGEPEGFDQTGDTEGAVQRFGLAVEYDFHGRYCSGSESTRLSGFADPV